MEPVARMPTGGQACVTEDRGMTASSNSSRERTVPTGEFKANCLRLMDEVQRPEP